MDQQGHGPTADRPPLFMPTIPCSHDQEEQKLWISNMNVCYLCTVLRMRLCVSVASHQSAVDKGRESDWMGFKVVGPTFVSFSFKSISGH